MTTHHLRTARACRAGACLLAGGTAYALTTSYWPASFILGYVAAFLAYLGRRERAAHRLTRALSQRAERLARPPELPLCCLMWQFTDGAHHSADCALGPHLLGSMARGWAELDAACCLRAWETCGADHDPTTCTRKDLAA